MGERGTGFHRLDPDYTRGREIALAEANSLVRRQEGLSRKVTMGLTEHERLMKAPWVNVPRKETP